VAGKYEPFLLVRQVFLAKENKKSKNSPEFFSRPFPFFYFHQ